MASAEIDTSVLSERFSLPLRSPEEWKRIQLEFLESEKKLGEDELDELAHSIRYAASQGEAAWDLLARLLLELKTQPDLPQHWFTGNHPQMTHLLNAALDAWRIGRQKDPTAKSVREVYNLLTHWVHWEPKLVLNTRTYTLLMHASRDPDLCENIMQKMLDQPQASPDHVAWTLLLNVASADPERVIGLLWKMMEGFERGVHQAMPNTATYNTVLQSIINANPKKYMEQAESLGNQMIDSPLPSVQPDIVTFQLFMYGWSKVNLDKAETWWRLLQTHPKVEGSPDIVAPLLNVAVRDKQYSRAEAWYQEVMQRWDTPGVHCRRAMLTLYCKTDRLELAQDMLNELEQVQDGLRPSHYRDVVHALASSGRDEDLVKAEEMLTNRRWSDDKKGVELDGMLWSPLLAGYSKSTRAEAPYRTEELLHSCPVPPTAKMYQSAISAWGRSARHIAPARAEKLLKELVSRGDKRRNMRPDRFHFVTVMSTWNRSSRSDALQHVSDLFRLAQSLSQTGNSATTPDYLMYGCLMTAYANRGDSRTCFRLLARMKAEFKKGNQDLRPTTTVYNIILTALRRQSTVASAKEAIKLIVLMEQGGPSSTNPISPDARSYNVLLDLLEDTGAGDAAIAFYQQARSRCREGG